MKTFVILSRLSISTKISFILSISPYFPRIQSSFFFFPSSRSFAFIIFSSLPPSLLPSSRRDTLLAPLEAG